MGDNLSHFCIGIDSLKNVTLEIGGTESATSREMGESILVYETIRGLSNVDLLPYCQDTAGVSDSWIFRLLCMLTEIGFMQVIIAKMCGFCWTGDTSIMCTP